MPNTSGIRWIRPPERMAQAVSEYGERVLVAVAAVAGRMATIMQNSAKSNAPWTDRTGNARSGLFGTVETAQNMVIIYLSHGVGLDYTVWLELAHSGRFAIVMRTIESHLPELKQMLDDIFG
jgi:hypothetical protein